MAYTAKISVGHSRIIEAWKAYIKSRAAKESKQRQSLNKLEGKVLKVIEKRARKGCRKTNFILKADGRTYICFLMRSGKTPKKIATFDNQYDFLNFFSVLKEYYCTLEKEEFTWTEDNGIYQVIFAEKGWNNYHHTMPFDTFERIGVQVTFNPQPTA